MKGRRSGFTVVELLLSAVLALLIGGLAVYIFQGTFSGMGTIHGQSIVQIQLRQALDQIIHDTRQARSATNGTACSGAFTSDPRGGVADGDATWILNLPPLIAGIVDVSAAPSDVIVYTYTYSSPPRQLQRVLGCAHPQSSRTAASENRLVSSNIDAIAFSKPPQTALGFDFYQRAVDVTLTVRRVEQGRPYQQSLTDRAIYRYQ